MDILMNVLWWLIAAFIVAMGIGALLIVLWPAKKLTPEEQEIKQLLYSTFPDKRDRRVLFEYLLKEQIESANAAGGSIFDPQQND